MTDPQVVAAQVAEQFHEAYERLAPSFSYEASAVPWPDVPASNRGLMTAVVAELVQRGVIAVTADLPEPEEIHLSIIDAASDLGQKDPV